jgi:hypothetical protein
VQTSRVGGPVAAWVLALAAGCAAAPPPRSAPRVSLRAQGTEHPQGAVTPAVAPPSTFSPPPKGAPPLPVPPVISAACGDRAGDRFRAWTTWRDRSFGTPFEVFHDGPDASRIARLTGEPRAEAERMLRLGLEACDSVAPEVLEQLTPARLLPELRSLLDATSSDFRAEVVRALAVLDREHDYTAFLLPLFTDRSMTARITATMAARFFPPAELRAPLLDVVRHDGSYLVRYHAAESLLALGDVHPAGLADHPVLLQSLAGQPQEEMRLLASGLLGVQATPSAEERRSFARAADLLGDLLHDRVTGRCSAPVRLDTLHHRFSQLDDHVLAVVVYEAESSCEHRLAFLVYLRSADGSASRSLGDLRRLARSIAFDGHDRLRLEGVQLDASTGNAALLEKGPTGWIVNYAEKANLTFAPGVDPVRSFLARSPGLRARLGR